MSVEVAYLEPEDPFPRQVTQICGKLVLLIGSSPPRPFCRWLGFLHRMVVEFQEAESGAASFLKSGSGHWYNVNLCCILWLSCPKAQVQREKIESSHFFGRYVKSFWGLIALIRCSSLKIYFCYHK